MRDTARERARRNTRGRFEQWAHNPTCEANTVSAVHNVKMADVAVADGITPSFGQSPFALARGETFERALLRDGATRMLDELVRTGVLPEGATGFVDHRLRMNGGGPLRSLDDALDRTRQLLVDLAAATLDPPPALVAAATVRIPRGVMLPEAILIIDVLAVRTDGDRPRLVVGEVKTYPDRGGHTDPGQLAGARAQAGLYVHALDVVCAELGITDRIDVDRDGFLVLSRPGSAFPSVRAGEDLRYQARRAERGFAQLEAAAQRLPTRWAPDDEPTASDLLDAVRTSGTSYGNSCLTFCDRAPVCHAAALAAGDPAVLGDDMARFLGSVDLHRATELLDGAPPANPAEVDLVERIAAADRLSVARVSP